MYLRNRMVTISKLVIIMLLLLVAFDQQTGHAQAVDEVEEEATRPRRTVHRPWPPDNGFGRLSPLEMPQLASVEAAPAPVPRGTLVERKTNMSRAVGEESPYFQRIWLTYYGRPDVPIMGILGEYPIEELIPVLREEAANYAAAAGPDITIQPAFHLVYGMATRAPGPNNAYLGYLEEERVMEYIEAGQAEGFGVILDVQIGALSPAESILPALPYLAYDNVHLAIDPEFAMVRPGQAVPGNPIGYVTAEEVNAVQAVIQEYMEENEIEGTRILIVHQFLDSMIVNKADITPDAPNIALTISADGWGGPWGKISKYNSFVDADTPFAAFKLFYRWDEPLLLPAEVLGEEPYRDSDFYMDVTPNLIMYQ
jgi:hypothetical protein